MRPPCEIIAKDVLPPIRSLVANELIERFGFTQLAVAHKLGITQAAISYYRDSKRGRKGSKEIEENPAIKKGVEELAEGIAKDILSEAEVALKFCKFCKYLRTHE